MNEKQAFADVYTALRHAESKHPDFASNLYQAITILTEEVGELAQSVNDGDITNIKLEAAQVAAVAIRILCSISK